MLTLMNLFLISVGWPRRLECTFGGERMVRTGNMSDLWAFNTHRFLADCLVPIILAKLHQRIWETALDYRIKIRSISSDFLVLDAFY